MKIFLRVITVCLAALTTLFTPPRAEASVVVLDIVEMTSYISPDKLTRWRLFSASASDTGQVIGSFEVGSRYDSGITHNWLYSLNNALLLEPKRIPAPPIVSISRPTAISVTEWWDAPRQTSPTSVEQHYFAFSTAQRLFGWILVNFGGPGDPMQAVVSGAVLQTERNEPPFPVPLPAGFILLATGLASLTLRKIKAPNVRYNLPKN